MERKQGSGIAYGCHISTSGGLNEMSLPASILRGVEAEYIPGIDEMSGMSIAARAWQVLETCTGV